MLTALVIILFALVLVLDFLPNTKDWLFRERFVYLTAFFAAFAVLLLHTLEVRLPSFYDVFMPLMKEILPNI